MCFTNHVINTDRAILSIDFINNICLLFRRVHRLEAAAMTHYRQWNFLARWKNRRSRGVEKLRQQSAESTSGRVATIHGNIDAAFCGGVLVDSAAAGQDNGVKTCGRVPSSRSRDRLKALQEHLPIVDEALLEQMLNDDAKGTSLLLRSTSNDDLVELNDTRRRGTAAIVEVRQRDCGIQTGAELLDPLLPGLRRRRTRHLGTVDLDVGLTLSPSKSGTASSDERKRFFQSGVGFCTSKVYSRPNDGLVGEVGAQQTFDGLPRQYGSRDGGNAGYTLDPYESGDSRMQLFDLHRSPYGRDAIDMIAEAADSDLDDLLVGSSPGSSSVDNEPHVIHGYSRYCDSVGWTPLPHPPLRRATTLRADKTRHEYDEEFGADGGGHWRTNDPRQSVIRRSNEAKIPTNFQSTSDDHRQIFRPRFMLSQDDKLILTLPSSPVRARNRNSIRPYLDDVDRWSPSTLAEVDRLHGTDRCRFNVPPRTSDADDRRSFDAIAGVCHRLIPSNENAVFSDQTKSCPSGDNDNGSSICRAGSAGVSVNHEDDEEEADEEEACAKSSSNDSREEAIFLGMRNLSDQVAAPPLPPTYAELYDFTARKSLTSAGNAFVRYAERPNEAATRKHKSAEGVLARFQSSDV